MGISDLILQALQMQSNTRPRQVSQIDNLPFSSNNMGLGMDQFNAPLNPFASVTPVNPFSIMPSNQQILGNYNDFQNQARQMGLINDSGLNELNNLIAETEKQASLVPNDVGIGTKLLSALTGFAGGFSGNNQLLAQSTNMLEGRRQQLASRKQELQNNALALKQSKANLLVKQQEDTRQQLNRIYSSIQESSGNIANTMTSLETQKSIYAVKNFYDNQLQDREDVRLEKSIRFNNLSQWGKNFEMFSNAGATDPVRAANEMNNTGVLSPESIKDINDGLAIKRQQQQELLDIQLGKVKPKVEGSQAGIINLEKAVNNTRQYGVNSSFVTKLQQNKSLAVGIPDLDQAISKYSGETGIPDYILYSVLDLEAAKDKDGKPIKNSVSPTGVKGYFQFTESTGKGYGLEKKEDFFDTDKITKAAAYYLKDLYEKYDGYMPAVLAAYNGGGAYAQQIIDAKGDVNKLQAVLSFRNPDQKLEEVKNYIKKGMANINGAEMVLGSTPESREAFTKAENEKIEKANKFRAELSKLVNDIRINTSMTKTRYEIDPLTGQPKRDESGYPVYITDPGSKTPAKFPMTEIERLAEASKAIEGRIISEYGSVERGFMIDPTLKTFVETTFQQLNPKQNVMNAEDLVKFEIDKQFAGKQLDENSIAQLGNYFKSTIQDPEQRKAIGLVLLKKSQEVTKAKQATKDLEGMTPTTTGSLSFTSMGNYLLPPGVNIGLSVIMDLLDSSYETVQESLKSRTMPKPDESIKVITPEEAYKNRGKTISVILDSRRKQMGR